MRLSVLGIVLAGGKGTRLFPLTKERAKPAVPFGGKYRIVDFVLSNFVNSGIYSIYVLTQFKSQTLLQHLCDGWQFGGLLKNHFVIPVPAQMRSTGETWYRGTADAIYQNINLIEQSNPHVVAIFGADHIYRMNITQHDRVPRAQDAPTSRSRRSRWTAGRPASSASSRRPATATSWASTRSAPMRRTIPGDPDARLRLHGQLRFLDAHAAARTARGCGATRTARTTSAATSCPRSSRRGGHVRLRFPDEPDPRRGSECRPPTGATWGRIDAYYEANMDLRSVSPALNLYNREWPLRTASYADPPAKFTFDEENRRGQAIDSIVSGGCILSGGMVRNSVLAAACACTAARWWRIP